MKRILAITFLNFFISGGLTLAIPLLLLERNVDLVEIGMIISVMPIVFMVVRLLMAAIADSKGWNRFYILLNWPWSILSTFVYFIASSTATFFLGKVLEALKESSYWAVSRTAIFSLSPERAEKEATRNIAILLFSTAVGSAVAGVGIAYFGFSFTLSILILAAGFIAIPAALLWKNPKQNSKSKNPRFREIINPRNKGKMFWLVSITSVFFSLAFFPLLNLLLPVFMVQHIGYDYLNVGIAYMMYNFIASIVILGTLRFSLGIGRVILQSSIALFATFLLASADYYFYVAFFALAVAKGLGWIFYESIIAKATKDRMNVSFDIGLLIVPLRFAEFGSVLYAGLIAQNLGYTPVFVSSGFFFLVFSVLAFYLLRNQ
ncbi:MAG: MFS transporter [Candidatus Bathyarchaeota archaeon]|nr:MFS transporter [Candidatus Bathyarchaeota archaeon]